MVGLIVVILLSGASVAAQFGPPPPPADPNAPVPKLANGKPDLSGSWQAVAGGQQGSGGDMFRRCTPFQSKNCMEWTNQSEDWPFMSATRLDQRQPLYKPEHWDKMIELDQWTNKYDPVMTCQPLGVPREGPPRRIYQTDRDETLIYTGGDAGGGYGEFRIIPTDGRKHDPKRLDTTFLGYTVGNWEGDTLALDSISFVDSTWIGRGGLIHSDSMRVVEKFTRQGDVLLYDVTVEDPIMFVEPYVMPTRVVRRSANPDGGLIRERGNCEVYEEGNISSQIRH